MSTHFANAVDIAPQPQFQTLEPSLLFVLFAFRRLHLQLAGSTNKRAPMNANTCQESVEAEEQAVLEVKIDDGRSVTKHSAEYVKGQKAFLCAP